MSTTIAIEKIDSGCLFVRTEEINVAVWNSENVNEEKEIEEEEEKLERKRSKLDAEIVKTQQYIDQIVPDKFSEYCTLLTGQQHKCFVLVVEKMIKKTKTQFLKNLQDLSLYGGKRHDECTQVGILIVLTEKL